MDLRIKGRNAIVCASSRGLGKACATALAREGCNVVVNGLDDERLRNTAAEIHAATGVVVKAIRADLRTDEGRQALVAALPRSRHPGEQQRRPAAGQVRGLGPRGVARGDRGQHAGPYLHDQGRAARHARPQVRPHREHHLGDGEGAAVSRDGIVDVARTGLTGLSKSLSRAVAVDNVTINNLLPERIDTDRQKFMAERIMKAENVTYEEARRRIADSLPAKRFGLPEEFGDACAFLCSAQAGFITGQNLQLDGGSYDGLV
jgi:3-oxoacyl-[acyl-carrier protein] reductase